MYKNKKIGNISDIDKTITFHGKENWGVKSISVSINSLGESENVSPNKYGTNQWAYQGRGVQTPLEIPKPFKIVPNNPIVKTVKNCWI